MEKDYEVWFKGKRYRLTDVPRFTDRYIPGCKRMKETKVGEEYYFHMAAPAFNDAGKNCEVSWIFSRIKGVAWDIESLTWDEVYDAYRVYQ